MFHFTDLFKKTHVSTKINLLYNIIPDHGSLTLETETNMMSQT